jgi:predicted RNA-binding Zn-ribbon protein involved in translation (DUF1610 family)
MKMSEVSGKFELSKKGRYKMDTQVVIKDCPKCGDHIPSNEHAGQYAGAISRRDNKTEICSGCGTKEALEDFLGMETCPDCWSVITDKNTKTGEQYAQHGGCYECYDPTPTYPDLG